MPQRTAQGQVSPCQESAETLAFPHREVTAMVLSGYIAPEQVLSASCSVQLDPWASDALDSLRQALVTSPGPSGSPVTSC